MDVSCNAGIGSSLEEPLTKDAGMDVSSHEETCDTLYRREAVQAIKGGLEKTAQSTFAYGKTINTYSKYVILKSIIAESSLISNNAITNTIHSLPDDVDEAWNKLLSSANVSTTEELCHQLFNDIGKNTDSLIYSVLKTFCKVEPLESETEWLDNFRLDEICNSMKLLIWDSDVDGVYGVGRKPSPKRDIQINFDRVSDLLVGRLRQFIIQNQLYPELPYKLNEPLINRQMSNEEICDECYTHYPFYFTGAHGCDVFDMPERMVSIAEIREFCKRYPSAIVGGILNTATYASRSGEHWVAIAFEDDRCAFINSSGRGVDDSFHDGGRLSAEIRAHFPVISPPTNELIQTDGHTCGIFASFALYFLICFDLDVRQAVRHIGKNGTNISQNKNIYDCKRVLALGGGSIEFESFTGGSLPKRTSACPAIVRYLLNELDTMITTSCNEKAFAKFKDVFVNRKIPEINRYLQFYEQDAIDTVEQEIYEELMSSDINQIALHPQRSRLNRKPSFDLHVPLLESIPSNEEAYDFIDRINSFNLALLKYKKDLKASISLSRLATEYKRQHRDITLRDFIKQRLEEILHI